MITIHLTDAERDQFVATGHIVVDGEQRLIQRPDGLAWEQLAPQLWGDMAQPCPTCDGDGRCCPERYADCVKSCPNPDCVGGRQVVTLTATCRWCEAKALNHPPKETGHNNGVVTLGRFTIPALWPVVRAVRGYWRTQPEGATWVSVYAEREATGYLDQITYGSRIPAQTIKFTLLGGILRREELALDPLPQPGQFVARPERVTP